MRGLIPASRFLHCAPQYLTVGSRQSILILPSQNKAISSRYHHRYRASTEWGVGLPIQFIEASQSP
ncbi:hypothetical protein ASPVEDRAFT_46832 [Aspergillus versicolor CBS 583.65]|uniref:Uncharacterized protein n=1 Tax=Aspergillus versicolor CBS 583.65 TaxID=1036611 RepID=A0A1L9Q1E2_ASPVE|nr:uncharacterized protein ASPVEDRAFT_46832 [Aspergillus versicolor CBS 583.65]OJJ07539.1 hypothetical protein ASPVEDRAFT_46832 [Aspergillus versicolor CBS 583.65]